MTVAISEFQAACEEPVAFTNTKDGSEYGYLVDIRGGYDINETAVRYLGKHEDLEVIFSIFLCIARQLQR